MKREVKILIGILLAVLVIAGAGIKGYRDRKASEAVATPAGSDTASPALLVRDTAQRMGAAAARVQIVEFLDPQCESCARMHPSTQRVLREFGADVALTVRYMPYHEHALFAASLLEASVEQGKYWEFLEATLASQSRWGAHTGAQPELLYDVAKEAGLDVEKLRASYMAHRAEYEARVERDRQDGTGLGVNGTPTYFINGHKLESLGYGALQAAVAAELAR